MPVHDSDSILKVITAHHSQLKAYGVNKIGLFGSYLGKEVRHDSDIDLLVDIQKDKKTFRNFMSLSYFLEEMLHNKVDLITVQSLSPHIGPHILKTVKYAFFPA
jgi:uncharacterized protein